MARAIEGYQVIAWYWSVLAYVVITVGIRLYVDFLGLRKVSWYRDVMVVFAVLLFISETSMVSISNDWDNLNITNDGAYGVELTPEHQRSTGKMNWAQIPILYTMYFLIKMDLLFLYHQLAPRASHPKFFWMIIGGWFFTVGSWLTTILWFFIKCPPFSTADLNATVCYWENSYLYATTGVNIISEVAIYIIPLYIIYRLQNWTFKRKLSAGWIFLVGLINILIMAANFGCGIFEIKYTDSLTLDTWLGLYAFSLIQTGITRITAFSVITMPQLKQFYRVLRAKTTNKSKLGVVEEGHGQESPMAESPAARPKPAPANVEISALYSSDTATQGTVPAGTVTSGTVGSMTIAGSR